MMTYTHYVILIVRRYGGIFFFSNTILYYNLHSETYTIGTFTI